MLIFICFPATPRHFTPGKTHQVLAPETPSHKQRPSTSKEEEEPAVHSNIARARKSDGVLYVKESPDVGGKKTEGGEGSRAQTTPRRVRQASLALHRKASFYSGRTLYALSFLFPFKQLVVSSLSTLPDCHLNGP